jgi:hypothetical protein
MKRTIALGLALATGLTGAATAAGKGDHGKDGKGHRAVSFSGDCQFAVNVTFDPPATGTPAQGRGFATGSGPCTGTFTDSRGRTHQLNGETVRYVASISGLISCSEGLAAGGGYLVFRGRKLRFSASETRAAAAGTLRFEGARGGSALGLVNVSASQDPVAMLQACAGPGLKEAPVDINFRTTPELSG